MHRLIVLSNRVKIAGDKPMAGGLAVALQDVLTVNSVIWMGWNGKTIDSANNGRANEFNSRQQTNIANTDKVQANTSINYLTTALTTKQYQHFYCGFANSVLWPLLHEQTDLISQAPEDYAGYQAVNFLFAKQLKKIIEPDDVIWVHDYHFLSVAYYCRQLGITNRIGFFLHVPFVSLPFWQQLDKSPELIKHLAHYDRLGTQTQQSKANCFAVVEHYLRNQFVPIKAYPIGTNVAKIQQQIRNLSLQLPAPLVKTTQNKKLIKTAAQQIIAVDRIDYSKGLLKRFSAYRTFLRQNPKYQNQLKLLQIACPSRLDLPVYRQLRDSVRQAVFDVNGQFISNEGIANDSKTADLITDTSSNPWQAITYSERTLSHEILMTMYNQSDVGWVNSIKDGMNLVAKEYVAAQNPENPGVLLLSRYAGAAEEMKASVIIDPNQPESIIKGLKTALMMPLSERQARHQKLLQGLHQNSLQVWHQNFLDDLIGNKKHPPHRLEPDIAKMAAS